MVAVERALTVSSYFYYSYGKEVKRNPTHTLVPSCSGRLLWCLVSGYRDELASASCFTFFSCFCDFYCCCCSKLSASTNSKVISDDAPHTSTMILFIKKTQERLQLNTDPITLLSCDRGLAVRLCHSTKVMEFDVNFHTTQNNKKKTTPSFRI